MDADGEPLTFNATGLPDGLNIDSETGLISGTLSLSSVGSHDVFVTVSDGTDSDSGSFTWTVTVVNQPPSIDTEPSDLTVTEPNPASFSVLASGDEPLSYQWRRDGVELPGETSATLNMVATDVALDDGAVFDVVVSNPYGTVTSIQAILHVIGSSSVITITPINRGIAAREGATGSGFILYSEENVHIRFSANPPNPHNSDHLIAVQFNGGEWFYDNNAGLFPFTPQPTDILVASVDFDADTITSLQSVSGTDNGIRLGYSSGDLTFLANWWNGGPNVGEFTVNGTQFVPNGIPPKVDVSPADLTVTQPEQAVFSVLASGDGPITYQWRRDGVELLGETSTTYLLATTDMLADDGAIFDVVISNPHGTAISDSATLSVNLTALPPTIEIQPIAQTVTEPDPVVFSAIASGNSPISYQWRRNGIDIPGATSTSYSLDPTDATSDNGAIFDVIVSNPYGTATSLQAQLTVDDPPTFITPINRGIAASEDATGTGYILYSEENVHTRFSANPPHPDNSDHLIAVQFDGVQWLYDNNSGHFPFTPRSTDTLLASVDFDADTITSLQGVSGTENGIRLGYSSGDLTFLPNWWNGAPNVGEFTVDGTHFVPSGLLPQIDMQPSDMMVTQPDQAVFSVLASGDGPLSYQWRRNGIDLPDETSTIYLLASTDMLADDGATFDVVVSNPHGTVISDIATLHVNLTPVPPTIDVQPVAQTVTEPNSASFSVTATGNTPLSYQWRRNGIDILGATSASYLLATTSVSDDGVTFDVVVSNPVGTVTSLPATLSVDPAPIIVSPINLGIAVQEDATGIGYILYSEENVHTRFADNPPHSNNSDHFIAVQFDGTQWLYDNNFGLFFFTPRSSDILIAEVDFSADTIASLQGVSETENGISKGYASGDLTFVANWWNGGPNIGEFTVEGTSFFPNSSGLLTAALSEKMFFPRPVMKKQGGLLQGMAQAKERGHRVELLFAGAIEPKGQAYRILCSPNLAKWRDCTDQFSLAERVVNSSQVPPVVTLKWVCDVEPATQEFFRIELQPFVSE